MFRVVVFLVAILGFLSTAFGSVVASDESGRYLSGVSNSQFISLSSDYGSSWNTTNPNDQYWSGIASDSTGQKLTIVSTCIDFSACPVPYSSTDRGATWTKAKTAVKGNWYSVASDSTGDKLVAASDGNIYYSTDGGATWARHPYLEVGSAGYAVALSADAFTAVFSYKNYIAINDKLTPSLQANWNSVATDATGTVIAGAFTVGHYTGGSSDSGVTVSTDGGISYTTIALSGDDIKYYAVAVSGDARLVIYGASTGVFVYDVTKKTTVKSNLSAMMNSIATSKDGQYVVANNPNNYFVSSDYGASFLQTK